MNNNYEHKDTQKLDHTQLRFNKVLKTIFNICEIGGFYLDGRITLVEKKTGRKFE